MAEQSQKTEMAAALKGDFQRLRERGVATTLPVGAGGPTAEAPTGRDDLPQAGDVHVVDILPGPPPEEPVVVPAAPAAAVAPPHEPLAPAELRAAVDVPPAATAEPVVPVVPFAEPARPAARRSLLGRLLGRG